MALPFEVNSTYFGPRAVMPRVWANEYTILELAAICRLWWDGEQWQRSFDTGRSSEIAKDFPWREHEILKRLKAYGMPSPSVKGWPRR